MWIFHCEIQLFEWRLKKELNIDAKQLQKYTTKPKVVRKGYWKFKSNCWGVENNTFPNSNEKLLKRF